jgi:hypothetical protein
VSLISLPVALLLMVGWRLGIHWVLGHPGDWRTNSDRGFRTVCHRRRPRNAATSRCRLSRRRFCR